MKKLISSIIFGVILLSICIVGYMLFKQNLFGWRGTLNISKIVTKNYTNYAPSFSFKYPDIFEIDSNQDAKYGKTYVVGIKLKTDNRTGCDIRLGGPEINFSSTDEQIIKEIADPIREKSKDFKLIEAKKTKFSNLDAFKFSFSFLDPIGARVRLDQVLVSSQNNRYIIICGAGEYQHSFFARDFDVFLNSLKFEK
jgi:hypothetical protein